MTLSVTTPKTPIANYFRGPPPEFATKCGYLRGVLKDNNFGDLWVGDYVPSKHNHLFASIQTLAAGEKFRQFAPDYFDFIIIDETHHASATTYDTLLEYFRPDLLLGLTATPERLDGEDITKYFNFRIASEIRLTKAIEDGLLCPFTISGYLMTWI